MIRVENYESLEEIAALAPKSPKEKSYYLLKSLIDRTSIFGDELELKKELCVLCFAQDVSELNNFARHLDSQEYVKISNDNDSPFTSQRIPYLRAGVTADGFDFLGDAANPLTIFISSTVYDLLDLRAELAEHLESAGHIVRMSEDYERFDVDQKSDSIQQCLNNLKASEVIICLLDQRFGGVIQDHANEHWNGKSATQVEYEYARKLDLPVYAFIRDKAELDAGLIRSGDGDRTRWIEARGRVEIKAKWLEFYDSLVKLKGNPQEPNWYDPFRTSVDLKKLVDKRLDDYVKSR
ncbi:DUF4062 domain-containing protein [Thalassoglobus sp.]|uniref:DUF4062 domain-containing protein n=1 Tax=Thalassoglobus sp. TaxID=2795869 RepID=UPI003AA8538C